MVLPVIAGAVLRSGATRAVATAGRRGAIIAFRASMAGGRLAVATATAATVVGVNAMRRNAQNSRNAQIEAQAANLRNSSASVPTTISGGFGYLINNTFFLFLAVVLFAMNFSRIIQSFELLIGGFFSTLNSFTPLNIQTTGMFATFDITLLALIYSVLVFIVILSYMFVRHKADGVVIASIWSIVYPFFVYFAFVGFGGTFLGPTVVEQVGNYIMNFTFLMILLFFIAFIMSNDSEEFKSRIGSVVKWLTIVLMLAWFILFLLSGTPQSLIFQERVDQEAQQVGESIQSFQLYWRCEIMQGNLRNLPECSVSEQETQVRRQVQEPFIFEEIRDSSSNVIREGRETVQFNYFISVPRTIDVRLTGYSCLVGTNRTTYDIPVHFSRLTQEIPLSGTNLRLECPVLESLNARDFQRGSINTVTARVYFEVQDTVHQLIPYVNCADSFFEEKDIRCSNLAREFWNGNIDDPSVLSFLNSVNDLVIGMYSTRGSVTGLRGHLPFYLNNPDEFGFNEFDYSINFREHNNLKIQNITLNSFRTPDYISINEASLIDTVRFTSRDNQISFPIELRLIDVAKPSIGSSEIMSFDFTINHYFEIRKSNIIIHDSLIPQEVEEPESIGEIFSGGENGELGDEEALDNGGGTSSSGGDSCIAICGPHNSACVRECREEQEVSPIPSQNTDPQRQQTPTHEQGSEIDEETGEEIPEEFDFENEIVISP